MLIDTAWALASLVGAVSTCNYRPQPYELRPHPSRIKQSQSFPAGAISTLRVNAWNLTPADRERIEGTPVKAEGCPSIDSVYAYPGRGRSRAVSGP